MWSKAFEGHGKTISKERAYLRENQKQAIISKQDKVWCSVETTLNVVNSSVNSSLTLQDWSLELPINHDVQLPPFTTMITLESEVRKLMSKAEKIESLSTDADGLTD